MPSIEVECHDSRGQGSRLLLCLFKLLLALCCVVRHRNEVFVIGLKTHTSTTVDVLPGSKPLSKLNVREDTNKQKQTNLNKQKPNKQQVTSVQGRLLPTLKPTKRVRAAR